MRSIKIAGLCLVAMFAVSMAISAAASAAAPVWLQCREGASGTKYEDNNCTVLDSTGKWGWQELATTEKVLTFGTLTLKDNKTLAGVSEVICGGTDTGTVGPGKYDRIESVSVKTSQCKAVKVCENVEEVEARDLPWQTELFETEKTVRDKITEVSGSGEPGWKVKCKAPILGSTTDECLTESGKEASTLVEGLNKNLVIDFRFESKSGKAKCTQGGKESGEVIGTDEGKTEAGWAMKVS